VQALSALRRVPTIAALTGRPLVAGRHVGAWLVLGLAIAVGLRTYDNLWMIGPTTWEVGYTYVSNYMGVNFHVYHVAAEQAIAGEPFYGVSPETASDGYVYLYPPITVAAFYPFTVFEWTTGYTVFIGLNVLAALGGTWLTVSYAESHGARLGWLDAALLAGLFVLSTHVVATVLYGNINILLGVVFAAGFWALARNRQVLAGTAVAIAGVFKIFPALVGLWLLRDRRWVAAGTTAAVGAGAILAGLAAFGIDPTVEYFTEVMTDRTDSSLFVGGYPADGLYYVTVQRPLSHWLWLAWPGAPYILLPIASALVCAGVLAYFYRRIETQTERLAAVFATVVVALVVMPSFRLYLTILFAPLAALLYAWHGRSLARYGFVAGGLVLSVTARPGEVIEFAETHLGAIAPVVVQAGGFATLQLYALGLMLGSLALAVHGERTDSAPS